MAKTKPHLQGKKTSEQRRRMLERKPDMPRTDADGDIVGDGEGRQARAMDRSKRQSEFPVSRGGMNQESQHHKHRADDT